jgi:hypothetical protein
VTVLRRARSSEKVEVNQGVKEGCPLTPILFGFYLDELRREWQKSMKDNFKTNYMILGTEHFTDDQVTNADTEDGLQKAVHLLEEVA